MVKSLIRDTMILKITHTYISNMTTWYLSLKMNSMLENPIWKLCCVAVVFLMDIVHSGDVYCNEYWLQNIGFDQLPWPSKQGLLQDYRVTRYDLMYDHHNINFHIVIWISVCEFVKHCSQSKLSCS